MKLFFTSMLMLILVQVKAHESDEWCDSNNIKVIGQITMSELVLKNLSHGVVCSIPMIDFENSFPAESSNHEISKYISQAVFGER